jgi:RNA polymerase sigma-70 factor (ECF subfamily)
MSADPRPADPRPDRFATTCWSEIRRAAAIEGDAADSLEKLCRQYWYPLYAFLRRAGHDSEAAEDHVQSFFADLFERRSLRRADPSRGRFRTFLLTACQNHVANRQRAESAMRRGGGRQRLPLDISEGEVRYAREPSEDWTAERLFERRWALTVIEAVFSRVRVDCEAKGRADRFDALRPLVAPAGPSPSHAEVAEQLGCSLGAVKVAAHRLRQQFGQALRDEISRTVDADEEADREEAIEEEVRSLLRALGGV